MDTRAQAKVGGRFERQRERLQSLSSELEQLASEVGMMPDATRTPSGQLGVGEPPSQRIVCRAREVGQSLPELSPAQPLSAEDEVESFKQSQTVVRKRASLC
eukprot:1683204-Rhodomonas_salina.1